LMPIRSANSCCVRFCSVRALLPCAKRAKILTKRLRQLALSRLRFSRHGG